MKTLHTGVNVSAATFRTGFGKVSKIKIHLPYDPAIPPRGLSKSNEFVRPKKNHTRISKTALLIIAPNWEQSKHLSTGR